MTVHRHPPQEKKESTQATVVMWLKVIGTVVSVGSVVVAILLNVIDAHIERAVSPVKVELATQVAHNSLPDENAKKIESLEQQFYQMGGDLRYIRGRIDEKWGSKDPSKNGR